MAKREDEGDVVEAGVYSIADPKTSRWRVTWVEFAAEMIAASSCWLIAAGFPLSGTKNVNTVVTTKEAARFLDTIVEEASAALEKRRSELVYSSMLNWVKFPAISCTRRQICVVKPGGGVGTVEPVVEEPVVDEFVEEFVAEDWRGPVVDVPEVGEPRVPASEALFW